MKGKWNEIAIVNERLEVFKTILLDNQWWTKRLVALIGDQCYKNFYNLSLKVLNENK